MTEFRTCSHCIEKKQIYLFKKSKKVKSGYLNICKACNVKQTLEDRLIKNPIHSPLFKICKGCHIEKKIQDFFKSYNSIQHPLYLLYCTECYHSQIRTNQHKLDWERYLKEHKDGYFLLKCDIHGNIGNEKILITHYLDHGIRYPKIHCIDCTDSKRISLYNEERLNKRLEENIPLRCSTCKITKEMKEFTNSELKSLNPRCSICRRIQYHKYEETTSISRKFKLTRIEYNKLWENQKGLCAICNLPETMVDKGKVRSLAADHCHKIQLETGETKIRGLLCTHCNNGLGRFKESSTLLKKAAKYLDDFNENS
jgi:hypothetical protein